MIVSQIPNEAWQMGGFFVLLLCLGFVVVKALLWIGTNLVIPARDRFFDHIAVVDENVTANTETLKANTDTLVQTKRAFEELVVAISTCPIQQCPKGFNDPNGKGPESLQRTAQ